MGRLYEVLWVWENAELFLPSDAQVVYVGALYLRSFVHESNLYPGKGMFLLARRACLYLSIWSVRVRIYSEYRVKPFLFCLLEIR